jgi:hypothetical protein
MGSATCTCSIAKGRFQPDSILSCCCLTCRPFCWIWIRYQGGIKWQRGLVPVWSKVPCSKLPCSNGHHPMCLFHRDKPFLVRVEQLLPSGYCAIRMHFRVRSGGDQVTTRCGTAEGRGLKGRYRCLLTRRPESRALPMKPSEFYLGPANTVSLCCLFHPFRAKFVNCTRWRAFL